MPNPAEAPPRAAGSLLLIALVVVAGAAAFAYTAGWLSPQRLTPEKLVDALGPTDAAKLGHRRNHAKGICFTGDFAANGAGSALSTAPMLATGHYPVIGRFAIGVANPGAPDAAGRVRSMAVRIVAPDGQEWRSGMNAMPFFPVATPEAFYDLLVATRPVAATGKPDPEVMKQFVGAHPEVLPFFQWAGSAPWTTSYADETYNSINAFRFIDGAGASHAVRWSMHATVPQETAAPAELAARGPDFLEQDLRQRVAKGPLAWHLVVIEAAPGDPAGDATKAWPADRRQVDVGTMTITQAEAEPDGPCRDFNYDPLILPAGIEPSDDPLLPARSAAYATSFDRRTAEASHYPHVSGAQP